LGIDEQVGQELSIYPNPTNGYFKIVPVTWDNGNLDIQVLDMHGRVILEQHYSGQKEYEVDLSWASAGSYEIKARTDNNLVVKKLSL